MKEGDDKLELGLEHVFGRGRELKSDSLIAAIERAHGPVSRLSCATNGR